MIFRAHVDKYSSTMEHMGIVSFQVPVSIVLWYFDDFDVLVPNNGN